MCVQSLFLKICPLAFAETPLSKPLAGCAGERWEEEMKTPSAFSSEFPVDLCPGQLGRAWAARSSNGAQRCPGSRPILLSASRSHPGSLYHTPSPQSHQICPTRLIFLKPPGLAQPGWDATAPRGPCSPWETPWESQPTMGFYLRGETRPGSAQKPPAPHSYQAGLLSEFHLGGNPTCPRLSESPRL